MSFYFVDGYNHGKCIVCKKGDRIDRDAYDVNEKGDLVSVCIMREHNRERPGVIRVGYTTCSNPRCSMHCNVGYRKVKDAQYLLKQIRAHSYKSRSKKRRPQRRR